MHRSSGTMLRARARARDRRLWLAKRVMRPNKKRLALPSFMGSVERPTERLLAFFFHYANETLALILLIRAGRFDGPSPLLLSF